MKAFVNKRQRVHVLTHKRLSTWFNPTPEIRNSDFWVFAKNVSNIDGLALPCVMFPLFTFEQHYNFKIFNLSLEKEIRWVVSTRFDRRWSRAGLRCVLLPLAGAYIDVGERCVCANQNIWGRRKPINCDTRVRMETQLRLVWRNAKRRKNFLSDWRRSLGY